MVSLQDFKASLKLMTGSRKMILSLTEQTKWLGTYAKEVVDAIVECIDSQVQGVDKMPGLYLLDSIFKNVGSPFAEIIQSQVNDIFCRMFVQAEKNVRTMLHTTRVSWNRQFPPELLSELDKRVRAMDPAWPDFHYIKVAGQEPGVLTPSSSSSSSSSSSKSPASSPLTSSCQEPSTIQGQFRLVYREDKQHQQPWPQFTNIGSWIPRMAPPPEFNTAPSCLTSRASPPDMAVIPEPLEVTAARPGRPLRKDSSSSRSSHHKPVTPGSLETTSDRPGHPMRKNSLLSIGSLHKPVIQESLDVTPGWPGHPHRKGSFSSRDKQQHPVIPESCEVTVVPVLPLRKESSSPSDRRHRPSSAVSKRRREKSPPRPSKRHRRER